MRTDGCRRTRRPRGALLRPLGLLLAAVMSSFGMWCVLTSDGRRWTPDRVAVRELYVVGRLLHGSH